MPEAASFLRRRRRRHGSDSLARRPRPLASFLTAARSVWLSLTSHTHTYTHTLTPQHPHTRTPDCSSLPHTPSLAWRARARDPALTARATPAEAAPRSPRPRRSAPSARVPRTRARPGPGPALQARRRGGAASGRPSEGRGQPAGQTWPSGSDTCVGTRPPGVPSPLATLAASGVEERRWGARARARAGRKRGARERFEDALSPPAPKPSSLRKGNGWRGEVCSQLETAW